MNFLAHLYLADGTEASLLGNFMGDFVKGSVQDVVREVGPDLARGVITHREVDAFTDEHPEFRAAKRLVSPERRRFAGIIVDVCFDHFLARHWPRFSDTELEHFIEAVYDVFGRNLDRFPPGARPVVHRMMEQDWLGSYGTVEGVGGILDRMAARRLRRGGDLMSGAAGELTANYESMESRFLSFFPRLVEHVRRLQRQRRPLR